MNIGPIGPRTNKEDESPSQGKGWVMVTQETHGEKEEDKTVGGLMVTQEAHREKEEDKTVGGLTQPNVATLLPRFG
ncbi:hypothetical protein NDU88_004111 [Pleurodeles waltl]|uniref:Uncharacterized protein n=1 Tax=Pleurodeles waltl TaxID=8319 RepID=A0AAV7WWR4_PLEWA|nr:hypothetical protein NDU88_004111 [Pleurodeles waltl]